MNSISTGREKVKTAILALLLAASIVQIGILWGDQSHRIPFNSLLGMFRQSFEENSVNADVAREELFVPYRLIASDGVEEHWIISRQDELHNRLWNNAKLVLKELVGKTPVKTYSESSYWGTVVSKKGVTFEFKNSLSKELVGWFLGVQGEVPSIYKFMIVPDGEDEKNLEVYICYLVDEKSYRTEKYLVSKKIWAIDSEEEEKILTTLAEDEKYLMSNYSLFGELNLGIELPDVPVAIKSPKFRPYKNLISNIPKAITHIGGDNTDEELADSVLGNNIDSYNRKSFTDSAQFKNTDSIYTIYRNGLLDYKYIPGSDSGKGNEDEALMNAYKFMSTIRKINNTKGSLYLSEVDSSIADKYVFKFDYLINGSPIFFDMSLDKGATLVKNAITIDANSKRVLRCTWMLRDLNLAGVENEYNVYFMDIADNQIDGETLKNICIRDLNIGYVATTEQQEEIIPSMVVEKSSPGIYVVKMPKRGD